VQAEDYRDRPQQEDQRHRFRGTWNEARSLKELKERIRERLAMRAEAERAEGTAREGEEGKS
jgi:hypothetical protein